MHAQTNQFISEAAELAVHTLVSRQAEMSGGHRECILEAQRRLHTANQKEVRVLAKVWGVPQKVSGDNRSVPELRRDLEQKLGKELAEQTEGPELPAKAGGVQAAPAQHQCVQD